MQPNPVKAISEARGVLTFAPDSLKDAELEKKIKSLEPDLFVVASYGKLIPASWLQVPKKLSLNLHPSLLPKHRGAAPITWQILEGDSETGVTVAEVTPKLDAGDIFYQIRIPLGTSETTESLTRQLAQLAGKALEETLVRMERESLQRVSQNDKDSTYARKLSKEDGYLDLKEPALLIERKIRAFHPWPGAFIPHQNGWLQLLSADCDSVACAEAEPGTLLEVSPQGYLRVQTGKGSLKISSVQRPGRRPISGLEFANGERLKPGYRFESSPKSR